MSYKKPNLRLFKIALKILISAAMQQYMIVYLKTD